MVTPPGASARFPDLEGKVAIVTGAAQSIGRAIAEVLVLQGMAVLLADVQPSVDDTAEALGRHGTAESVRADLTRPEDVERMVAAAPARFGRLDLLVNNARWERVASTTELEVEDWDRTMAVLLRSHYLAAKHAIPMMVNGGGGSIVGISSPHAAGVAPGFGAYGVAKAGVDRLVRQIAYEFGGQGVRANAVVPGSVLTETTAPALEADPALEDKLRVLHPRGRIVTGQEIGTLVAFLASDASTMITGQSITIDGGLTLPLPSAAVDRYLAASGGG